MNFFITGATGFIGSHLTNVLLKRDFNATILLNPHSSTIYSHRSSKLHTIQGDLLDLPKMTAAMERCDVVVHLAYGSRGTPKDRYRITVDGTKTLLKAASKAGVKRFIHMSTASVYGEPPKNKLYTEQEPRHASLDLYTSMKQEAEQVALEAPYPDLEVAVLQPSIIYGPGSGYWTAGLINILKQYTFPLVNDGEGLCNLVYVSDVVDAILSAATVPNINRERFLLANDSPVTWKTLLRSYEKILNRKCLVNLPASLMKQYNTWNHYKNKVPEYQYYARALKLFFKFRQLPNSANKIKFPDNDKVDFFAAKPIFSNQKAKDILNFSPKINFEQGMGMIQDWVAKGQPHL